MAGAAGPVLASAPFTSLRPVPRPGPTPPPEASGLIADAGLGGAVSFAVADLATGRMLEDRQPGLAQSPASVAKAVTALYAMQTLGQTHRFRTELIATGPMRNGRIEGDLVLAGGGDPLLDTDALSDLIAAAKAEGLREVSGSLRVWDGALPRIDRIDAGQPDHVGYNPAIGGLNLNFNRVHFEWVRGAQGYEVTMEARARRLSPAVDIARMEISDRRVPVYSYRQEGGIDRWSVARAALGNGGSRGLPVRRPSAFAQEVFVTLARSHGIVLRSGDPVAARPEGAVIARHESAELRDVMRGMLRFSTNLTAEAAGLAASVRLGGAPGGLAASGARMAGWASARYGVNGARFADHSGLGYASAISARDMVQLLVRSGQEAALRPILRGFPLRDADGTDIPEARIAVAAKTGTLNFVSALAGYVRAADGRDLAFAIFTGDTARRDAVPPEARERPEGARGWARRSRRLQQGLILRWADVYGA